MTSIHITDEKCIIEEKVFPAVGFGTYRLKDRTCLQAVKHAVDYGYRIIDTATLYENFKPIGQAIKSYDREKLYLISKVWPNAQKPKDLKNDLRNTLKQLDVDYLDAYLIHWPLHTIPIENTLQAMHELREKGEIRHIGLSNVTVNHLRRVFEVGIPISWVQVEMHPFFYDQALLEFCHKHSLVIQAWAPLARGRLLTDPLLKAIAERYKKMPTQVALRWIMQHGCLPLPSSQNEAHIETNFDVFDFALSKQEMDEIDAKARTGERYRITKENGIGFSDEFDFTYEECWSRKSPIH